MTLTEYLDRTLQGCKKLACEVEASHRRGLLTDEDARNQKKQIAVEAWKKAEQLCEREGIKYDAEAFQAVFASVGICVKKVPVRFYPTVQIMRGVYCFSNLKNIESLVNDDDPIGKTFQFQVSVKMVDENIWVDYYFKAQREELEKEGTVREGWKCYKGYGKIEGYAWADASISYRMQEGGLKCRSFQKMYYRPEEPIWKRHSAQPVDGYAWIGIDEDIPNDLEIPEGGFYSDETIKPPRGRHYGEQGILAYDDTEEIIILGITDSEAEIVEIPREINGKPVTGIDQNCFENCRMTLRKVILPDTIKEIGDNAFDGCYKLERP